MKQDEDVRKRARAEQLYAWFLRLYPGAYRRTFGQPMRETFQDHYRDAIETEGESEVRFWLGVISDEGKSLVREHVAALRDLTGFINLVVDQVSWLLLVMLLWHAIQHNLLQSSLESDFQRDLQNSGQAPSLWSFLYWEIFGDGILFPVIVSLIALAVEGLCATLGGAIGAALRRADDGDHQAVLPNPRPVGFILIMLVLGLLMWAGYAEFQSLGVLHRLLTLSDLSSSFTSQAFALWLLGFLVMLAFVFVSAQLNPARPGTSAASR